MKDLIESVEAVTALGLMQGDENGSFKPKDNITKEQVIVTLLKLDDINQKWKKKEEYKMKKIIASVLSVTLLISAMMGVASAQEVESYNVNVTTTANNAEVENPGVFEGIELPMSCEEAVQEASRCLRCDRHGCGTLRGGREFEW